MAKIIKDRRKKMLIGEHRLKIIDFLEKKGNVIVSELSSLLSVTEETIRRDLEGLKKEELLKRTEVQYLPIELALSSPLRQEK